MGPLLHKAAIALAAYGPWGIFALAAIDSLGVPLPAAIDLLVAGIAATSAHAPMRAYGAAVLAVAGSLGGNIGLFQAVRRGRRLVSSRGPEQGSSTKFAAWFQRYGLLTVFVPAVTPVPPLPLKVFVISAGALRTPFRRFAAVILAARTIRYFGLAWLGMQVGADAPGFLRRNGWMVAGGALAMTLMLACLKRRRDGRQSLETAPGAKDQCLTAADACR
jgi:membrane protein DedA with SNARE-associated domain